MDIDIEESCEMENTSKEKTGIFWKLTERN